MPIFGQAQVSPEFLRENAGYLVELKAARANIAALTTYIDKLKELETREAALSGKELELERALRMVAERERDIERARADQLDVLVKSLTKKSGFGRALCKIFSLGLARC